MTVLGKVAVPKPLNLPSQRYEILADLNFWFFDLIICVSKFVCTWIFWRLENHGLDPNVEIVPKWVPVFFFNSYFLFKPFLYWCPPAAGIGTSVRYLFGFPALGRAVWYVLFLCWFDLGPSLLFWHRGTLSWGSRTSSSTSNPWGSSTHSPNADGGSSSPSHLRSRPSSGSGTRPSTAGSDRTQEPTTSAWGTSSRPLSASGPLSSNKVPSTLARPHSAETRPGSSQLSRFAEPVSEHPVAWGATTTAERLVRCLLLFDVLFPLWWISLSCSFTKCLFFLLGGGGDKLYEMY